MSSETEIETGRAEIQAILCRAGVISLGTSIELKPLEGGVSSDIFRVDLKTRPICIKKARAKLKVRADWRAPVTRNLFEALWFQIVGAIEPNAAPDIIHIDAAANAIVMEFLEPATHPVWKAMLRDGQVDPAVAAQLGTILANIHAATATRNDIRRVFPTDRIFFDIRLEPYLLATGAQHPDLAPLLERLARRTAETKLALVHGDVSPKNILIGAKGPVLLDAECAWFGDPAFDLAFCLNHLLLKCIWRPQHAARYLTCFDALSQTYLQKVSWEHAEDTEARAADLLPALLLARIDGKSPVEYINEAVDRERVRHVAFPLIRQPVSRLAQIRAVWSEEMGLDEPEQDNSVEGPAGLGQSRTSDPRS
ncbi:MAG: aminoglycoside phosphotransferase family protein [Pseudomonadota bacterium]